MSDRLVTVETAQLGKFAVPLTAVGSIRLASLDRQLSDAWKILAAREVNQDMLVIAKANVLDHLDGTVGAIDDKMIHFVLDGEERTAKREKLFGIVYARRNVEAGKPVCELSLAGGDLLKAQSVSWADGQLKIGLLGGATPHTAGRTGSCPRFQLRKGPLPLAARAAGSQIHAILRPGLDLLPGPTAGRRVSSAGQQGICPRVVDPFAARSSNTA